LIVVAYDAKNRPRRALLTQVRSDAIQARESSSSRAATGQQISQESFCHVALHASIHEDGGSFKAVIVSLHLHSFKAVIVSLHLHDGFAALATNSNSRAILLS